MTEQEPPKIKVLTAGGAAAGAGTGAGGSPGKSKKKRNRRGGKAKKKTPQVEEAQNKPTIQKEEPASKPAATLESGHLEMEQASLNSDHGEQPQEVLGGDGDDVDDDGVLVEDIALNSCESGSDNEFGDAAVLQTPFSDDPSKAEQRLMPTLPKPSVGGTNTHELFWLFVCFLGIMASFVCYGLLLEYTTSGGRKLHELSFLFVTSGLYTLTAAAGRYVRDETPTTIPPARFAVLGLTSMGSTFCSVRSLRYVIFPIQVLAKSCKPVPVMLFGAAMGKRYPLRKYVNVIMIVVGVALFMGGGDNNKKGSDENSSLDSASQMIGILLLFVSLCFDGGTGAYEDKLMSVHSVQPFDLMFNIQLGKTILAGIGLLVLNQVHVFLQMIQEMGFLLVALGFTGAMGQVFIFVTIAKFGALTCSIIGLARKVTTLVASIYIYGHHLSAVQFSGLVISVTAMIMNFWGKKKGGGGGRHHGHGPPPHIAPSEELQKMLGDDDEDDDVSSGDVELAQTKANY